MSRGSIFLNIVAHGLVRWIRADGGEPDRVERLVESIPMECGAEPVEIANSIAWLMSEEVFYVTGNFIEAAGGR